MSQKDRIRLLIAQETARLIVEEGYHDRQAARHKAAERLRLCYPRNLPREEEIELALAEYHRIYRPSIQPAHIQRLRRLALEAMQFLSEFSPFLVGGAWDGSAGRFSPITLHLYAATPEDVIRKLLDQHIPFEQGLRAAGAADGQMIEHPLLTLYVDDTQLELIVFPQDLIRRRNRKQGGDIPAVRALTTQDHG